MGELVLGHELQLVCKDGCTSEIYRRYLDFIRQKETHVTGDDGETPFSDRLDTKRREVPSGKMLTGSWLKDSIREAVNDDEIRAVFEPLRVGDNYVYDHERLQTLLDIFREAKEEYLERESTTRPFPDKRVISPEHRFEIEYAAKIEFALKYDECGIGMVF